MNKLTVANPLAAFAAAGAGGAAGAAGARRCDCAERPGAVDRWLADPVTRWAGRLVTLSAASTVSMLLALAAISAGQYVFTGTPVMH